MPFQETRKIIMDFIASIVALITSLIVAFFLSKLTRFSFISERDSRLDTLDGLRGFLAIFVFFHHYVITYYWKTTDQWIRPPEDYYHNYGKVGVALFFMITGFLFLSKILTLRRSIDWLKVYESRFYRIMPLYIFVLLAISLVVFANTEYQLVSSISELTEQYVRWFFFIGNRINEFADTRTIIAGVDWTLKYEWLFYLLLPVIASIVLSKFRIFSIVLLLTILYLYIKPIPMPLFSTQYFILFALGGLIALAVKMIEIPNKIVDSRLASSLSSVLLLGLIFYPNTMDIVHHLMMFLFFFLVVFGNSIFGILRLNASRILGEVSYSIYLLHGLILYLLFTQFNLYDIKEIKPEYYVLLMPVVAVLVVLVSSVTFLLIERPFIKFGQKYHTTNFTRRQIQMFKAHRSRSNNIKHK